MEELGAKTDMAVNVVDYGLGNVGSVVNMLRRLGVKASGINSPEVIRCSRKLILPGVGAFDSGMAALQASGLGEAVKEAVLLRGAKLLGICLGMQLLFERSEEGEMPGLGLLPGEVRRLRLKEYGLRVPHMGWNTVRPVRDSVLLSSRSSELRFYFVHSYHAVCEDSGDVVGVTDYGQELAAVVERECVYGTQFHPEKSHSFGMELLSRYSRA